MMTIRALVLRRSDWRDYDRMVTLLSPEMGRVEAVVRGCKRPKSPLMNAAEPFCAGEFTLNERGGRCAVIACQINECYFPLREDYDRLTHGVYYLNLLAQAALPGEDSEELFQLALRALAFLSYGELPAPMVTMAFELHYLALLGQAPRMDECVLCGSPVRGPAAFSDRLGGAVCPKCAGAVSSDSGVFGSGSKGRRFPGESTHPLSEGARRILLRVPKTRFDVIDKLLGHPDWIEAAAHARRFILERMEQLPRTLPGLMTEEDHDKRP